MPDHRDPASGFSYPCLFQRANLPEYQLVRLPIYLRGSRAGLLPKVYLWDYDCYPCPYIFARDDLEPAPVALDDPLSNCQSQSAAAGLLGAGVIRTVEPFEYMRDIAFADPDTAVLYGKCGMAIHSQASENDLPARRGVF